MKKAVCSLLAGALIATSAPAFCEEAAYFTRPAQRTATVSVREAAKASVAAALAQASLNENRAAATFLPRTMPRGDNGARRQVTGGGGGSKTGLIVGLVTTVAGAAGGYLLYKQMKDDSKKTNAQ